MWEKIAFWFSFSWDRPQPLYRLVQNHATHQHSRTRTYATNTHMQKGTYTHIHRRSHRNTQIIPFNRWHFLSLVLNLMPILYSRPHLLGWPWYDRVFAPRCKKPIQQNNLWHIFVFTSKDKKNLISLRKENNSHQVSTWSERMTLN